jgi:8-oxo-dGTP pyrophosphatase MutT (NUDIX family)
MTAAVRELKEETGITSARIVAIVRLLLSMSPVHVALMFRHSELPPACSL